ncbi:transposase [Methanotorris formicicus]|uniref:transposase n=1 Tax=Methanotorris formicicus TaxID=213185 RepID=UPI003A4E2006
MYKKGYEFLIEGLGLFPKIRYNKLVERLNRYEELLFEIQSIFLNKNCLLSIDTIPIETKELIRKYRHEKIGKSMLIKKDGIVGYNASKKRYYFGYKATYTTDEMYLTLLFVSPANQHDLDVLKDNYKLFVKNFSNCSIIGDKGYIDEGFQNMLGWGNVYFESIKRNNMIKSFIEKIKYKILNKLRKTIETNFSKLVEMFPKRIRAISKRGFSVKLLLFTIAYNIKTLYDVNLGKFVNNGYYFNC